LPISHLTISWSIPASNGSFSNTGTLYTLDKALGLLACVIASATSPDGTAVSPTASDIMQARNAVSSAISSGSTCTGSLNVNLAINWPTSNYMWDVLLIVQMLGSYMTSPTAQVLSALITGIQSSFAQPLSS